MINKVIKMPLTEKERLKLYKWFRENFAVKIGVANARNKAYDLIRTLESD